MRVAQGDGRRVERGRGGSIHVAETRNALVPCQSECLRVGVLRMWQACGHGSPGGAAEFKGAGGFKLVGKGGWVWDGKM